MITLNTDMYLLCSLFNISYKKITSDYSGMTVEEIMKAEAKQGNTAAANFDETILNDPAKLIQLFELKDPGNKYAILSNLNQDDLDDLLPMLDQADLIQGLSYFSKDKLLSMTGELPKEQLLNLTFQMMSKDHIMQFMPDEQLNQVLQSPDMDKNLEIKYLQTIKPEILAQMIEAATGEPAPGAQNTGMDGVHYDVKGMVNQISTMDDSKFQDAILSIPTANKQQFVYNLANENPKIYEMFDSSAYINIINQKKDKQDIIRYANVIESDQLVNMVSQLPKELTSVVLTQIDTQKFADVLLKNYKDIISQIVAG